MINQQTKLAQVKCVKVIESFDQQNGAAATLWVQSSGMCGLPSGIFPCNSCALSNQDPFLPDDGNHDP